MKALEGYKTYLAVAATLLTALADWLGASVPPELYMTEGSLIAAFLRAGMKKLDGARPRF
jgi:hypothetical protein